MAQDWWQTCYAILKILLILSIFFFVRVFPVVWLVLAVRQ